MLRGRALFLLAFLSFLVSHSYSAATHQIAQADWAALNDSVNGRLFMLRPFAHPCYTSYDGVAKPVDEQTCADISAQRNNASYLTEQAAGLIQV